MKDSPFNNVHEIGKAIYENKHLYTEDEFLELSKGWLIQYREYLLSGKS